MAKSTWVVDASHSLAEFTVKHMMFTNVKGQFKKVEGTVVADPADLTGAELKGTVDAASVDTGDAQRDDHLRSADFFDVANFPTLSFASKSVEKAGDDYRMVGDLTIHGVTQTVTWDLTLDGTGKDPWGNDRIGLTAETRINRHDFGLMWNAALEAGGILVGEQVKIAVHLQAIKQQ